MTIELSERGPNGYDKVSRYGWEIVDKPGDMMWIRKSELKVDGVYQREATAQRVVRITKEWSWVACGVILVSRRGDAYWVIDGQHRVLAAMRRSDIQALPCIVFEIAGVKEEAQGFLSANGTVKPITALARAKAMAVAGDPTAELVQRMFAEIGLRPLASGQGAGGVRCVAWCLQKAKEDPELFENVIRIVGTMCLEAGLTVPESLLGGLWLLYKRSEGGLADDRIITRLHNVGVVRLIDACKRAEFLANLRNATVWCGAILEQINKGHRSKVRLK